MPSATRVAVVHDYVTQRGGAERVAMELATNVFPDAVFASSVYEPTQTFPGFQALDVLTSPLQRVAAFRRDPRKALPLLAPAMSRLRLPEVDVVVCSSSGWAHGVEAGDAARLVYCYNPARWLYQQQEYLAGMPARAVAATRLLGPALRRWDLRAAHRSDKYIAISSVVSTRIKNAYGIDAMVVPPPVLIDPTGLQTPVAGVDGGYLLTVSRQRAYKNVEVLVEAVRGTSGTRLVVVGDAPRESDPPNVIRVGRVSDAQLRWLYAHCEAVVSVSYEDFGLTPLEGNAFGRPAVVLRAGGFLDTLVEGTTGVFVEDVSTSAVRRSIYRLRDTVFDNSAIMDHAQQFGPGPFAQRMRDEVEGLASNRS